MERKIRNLEEHVTFLYDDLELKEKEIDDLKKNLDDANDKCRKQTASKFRDNEDIIDLKKVIEEQEIKISCLRKHRNEILDRHEHTIDEYEKEFKAKEEDIKFMQDVSCGKKQQIVDLQEELRAKDAKINELLEKNNEAAMKSTQTSLFEELANAESDKNLKQMQERIGDLEKKLMDSHAKSKVRMKMVEKMKFFEESNRDNLEHLEKKIKMLSNAKKFSKCRFGVKCRRKFCKFDHSFVFRKINTKPSPDLPCTKCEIHFETEGKLTEHLVNHEHEQFGDGNNIDESVESSSRHEESEDSDQVEIIDDKSNDSTGEYSDSCSTGVSDNETQTESENGEV